jgi:Tetratricopeptide repeat
MHDLSLKERLRVLGPEHPLTLCSMDLAVTYEDLGRLTPAADLHQQTLQAIVRVLGHSHTRSSLNALAHLYRRCERFSEAKLLLEEADGRETVMNRALIDEFKAVEGILDVTGNGGQERNLVFISVTLEMLKCAGLQVMDPAAISDETLMHGIVRDTTGK